MSKILEYLKMTAIVNPYANITFIDPKGRLYKFNRITEKMPNPPKEILPHPFGVDVEMINRIIAVTKSRNMYDFMRTHFHRVGKSTASNFLKFANIREKKNPKRLSPKELVQLVQAMKQFDQFLPPDSNCLSPLGRELMTAGILKELKPSFTAVSKSRPSTYSGHPFIVEVGIAYGGEIPRKNDITLYRFANRIPLLYDEGSDVSWSVIRSINWRRYKVTSDLPVAVLVHICSTKIPYKTVGKEFIASIPEVRRELLNGIREVARQLGRFLSRQANVQKQRRRLNIFGEYLPKIARFSTDLSGNEKLPDISKLYFRKKIFDNFETTNFFSDSDVFEAKEYKTKLLHIYNRHPDNSVRIRILVSRMNLFWNEFRSEITLNPKSQMYEMVTEKWHFLKIQTKSAHSEEPGILDAYVDGLSE
jgi:DNA topoisomerase-6 subunit B